MSDKKEADKDGQEPKKSKKLLLIIVAVVALVIAGAGGYMMFAGGSSKGAKPAKPKPVPGTVLALDALTVNLAGGHYLKVKLALQLTASADPKTDGSQALDLAITEFSDLPMSDLSSETGREKVKAALLEKVGAAYEDKVMDIYFTQFVMQ
ncbi:MAG TPA: flagellar basal body-associated FliL family protein [Rugosimonospora sp.]|nr:flagellar basal body-associated FliL family protein [Rugosimonospora sp.]